jgi:hypothetical protein
LSFTLFYTFELFLSLFFFFFSSCTAFHSLWQEKLIAARRFVHSLTGPECQSAHRATLWDETNAIQQKTGQLGNCTRLFRTISLVNLKPRLRSKESFVFSISQRIFLPRNRACARDERTKISYASHTCLPDDGREKLRGLRSLGTFRCFRPKRRQDERLIACIVT